MRDRRRRISIAQARKHGLDRYKTGLRKQFGQRSKITGRQVVQLDADAGIRQAVLAQEGGEHVHGVEFELTPDGNLRPRRRFGADRARLHIDDDERNGPGD